jgi:putative peptidoglycan lipid II flippase
VTRAAGVVGLATLLSRIFGYVRDMVLASFFGAGMAADAFIAAFRIPNLLRRLFGEGSLSMAFVPVFTEALASGDRDDGLRLAVSALKLLLVCLSVDRRCWCGGRTADHSGSWRPGFPPPRKRWPLR